jgi:hypothetical protein
MRFLYLKTDFQVIESVGRVATAPNRRARTAAPCSYVVLSASRVAGGRETQWRQRKGKERCVNCVTFWGLL